jgi:hypothetical protein
VAGLRSLPNHTAAGARAAGLALLLAAAPGFAQLTICDQTRDGPAIAAALRAIRSSVDPCGESPELAAMLATLERCAPGHYRICTDRATHRNVFDRPIGSDPRTITWNPELRSMLEPACDDGLRGGVLRDPTASLVHELAHAAQDCEGLNPGEHELEAVRLENVYRRATGLCQRHGYGDEPLPPDMVRTCTPGRCTCSPPTEVATSAALESVGIPSTPEVSSSGDSRPLCEAR